MEKGATHYTHWFQPLTGSTAEKHDSFYAPAGDGTAIAEFSGKELIQGEPDASSFPTGGIRATFEARGYTAWDPTSPGVHPREPQRRAAVHPDRVHLLDRRGARPQDPAAALDGRAVGRGDPRARAARRSSRRRRVFTTIGREQEYFLIDEQYYFERPDLLTTGRTLFGAKPPKGHELDDHYFGSIPERILAYMLETEQELAKLGVPIKTRHNEVAPNQYEIAPIFENSNVGSDHQQLTMQIMQNIARRYGLVCLLHEKPFAGVNGSGKHNNWSMGTDTGMNLLEPGDTPVGEPAVPVLLHRRHPGGQRAPGAAARVDRQRPARTTASAPTRRRRRSSRSSSAPSSRRCSRRSQSGKVAAPPSPARSSASARPVLPPLPLHGGDRNRTSPFAFTGNKFEFRALGSSPSPALPNTVLNTIVAEAIDDLADKLKAALKGAPAQPREGASPRSSRRARRPTSGSSSTATTTRRRGTRRPRSAACTTCAPRPTRCRGWSTKAPSRCSRSTRSCPSASSRPATRSSPSSTRSRSTSSPRPRRRSRAR